MKKILIIDDEPSILSSLRYALNRSYQVFTALNSQTGLKILLEQHPDLVLLDLKLGQESGLDVLKKIKEIKSDQVVIIITAFATIETTINAIKAGAFYYLTKPLDLSELTILVEKGLEVSRLRSQIKTLSEEIEYHKGPAGMVGRSQAMRNVFSVIDQVKDIDSHLLITGSTGTGKELVAKAVHRFGSRSKKPMITINCAAIPSNLLESELFGYEKGAFTGASSAYRGKIIQANGGIIFFDEISEMELTLQAKLLRFLEDKKVSPLGSNQEYDVDVRVIAATNINLEQASSEGKFRLDLFYRLNVVNIKLPDLIDRQEDIPILTQFFIEEFSKGKQKVSLTTEALALLTNHTFPGNVRELKNLIERCVIFSQGDEITATDIRKYLNLLQIKKENDQLAIYVGDSIFAAEKKLIEATLKATNDHRVKAAKLLGITDRTLRNKLKIYEQAEK